MTKWENLTLKGRIAELEGENKQLREELSRSHWFTKLLRDCLDAYTESDECKCPDGEVTRDTICRRCVAVAVTG